MTCHILPKALEVMLPVLMTCMANTQQGNYEGLHETREEEETMGLGEIRQQQGGKPRPGMKK